jgi:CRISPR/Cas system CSM-associated protein Csm3 (group 7 of RAMP superfamily)
MDDHDMPGGPPPTLKQFVLIALPVANVERSAPPRHDTFDSAGLTGRLELELEALTPIHVATGLLALTNRPGQPLARQLVRVAGAPVIPGSSFKGCVRAIAEAITASCVRATRAPNLGPLRGCNRKEELCITCRTFGGPGYFGPLRFGDLPRLPGRIEIASAPQLHEPGKQALFYQEEGRPAGRKFYMHSERQAQGDTPMEVCARESRFVGAIDFTNLRPEQLGLLLVSLGQHPSHGFALKLGGFKPACYGSVRVRVARLMITNAQARYEDWDGGGTVDGEISAYLAAAERVLAPAQLEALANTLRWPNETHVCPEGTY